MGERHRLRRALSNCGQTADSGIDQRYPGADSEIYLRDWPEYQRRRADEEAARGELRNSTIFVRDPVRAPKYLELIRDLDDGDWSYQRSMDGRMHPWVNGDPVRILVEAGKPILILHGERDMGFPVQLAERLHRAIPTSRLAIVPDTAHMCHFERPELWSSLIRCFLAADRGSNEKPSTKDRAVAVMLHDGQLLVVKRIRDGRRYAVLPGGGVEMGEDPADAALRELVEETGLAGRQVEALWRMQHQDRVAHYFLVEADRGPLILGGPEVSTQSDQNRYQPSWVDVGFLDEIGLEPSELRELLKVVS